MDRLAYVSRSASETGLSLVALRVYIKDHMAQVELWLARGKRKYDKRRAIIERGLELGGPPGREGASLACSQRTLRGRYYHSADGNGREADGQRLPGLTPILTAEQLSSIGTRISAAGLIGVPVNCNHHVIIRSHRAY